MKVFIVEDIRQIFSLKLLFCILSFFGVKSGLVHLQLVDLPLQVRNPQFSSLTEIKEKQVGWEQNCINSWILDDTDTRMKAV